VRGALGNHRDHPPARSGLICVLAAAAVAAAVLASTAGAAHVEGPFGHGDEEVWLVLPLGTARSIVVVAHGWKSSPPKYDSWVRQFGPWMTHLTTHGNAVIFPRYQLGHRNDVPGRGRAAAFRTGVAVGLKRLGLQGLPVVVAGYSFGGSLAMSYAADAVQWGLPRPKAVDSIFPAGPIRHVPFTHVAGSTRVLLEVGDRDTVAGTYGAKAFWHLLRGHSRKQYEVVHSHGRFVATHPAPKLYSKAARAAFWAPLDRLIALSRR
jgi:poly(3-hydroxybutyrate) depolymerase